MSKHWKNNIIRKWFWDRREYREKLYHHKLNYLESKGMEISKCPDGCGGVRFQCDPNAKCRGGFTCWYKKRISYVDLEDRASKQVSCCCICGDVFIMSSKSKKFCSSKCKGEVYRKCHGCNEDKNMNELVKLQVLSGKRTVGKRGTSDNFNHSSFHELFCGKDCYEDYVNEDKGKQVQG